jgi:hypothetical protein
MLLLEPTQFSQLAPELEPPLPLVRELLLLASVLLLLERLAF